MVLKDAVSREPKSFVPILRDGHAEEMRHTLTAVERNAGKSRVSNEQLWDAFNRGLTNEEIAEETGLSKASITGRLRGLGLRRKQGYVKKVPDEVIRKVHERGGSYPEIAESIGMSVSSTRIRLKELGLESNRPKVVVKVSDEDIIDDLKAGLTRSEIARKHEILRSGLYRRIKKLMPEIERQGIVIVEGKKGRPKATQIPMVTAPRWRVESAKAELEQLGIDLSKAPPALKEIFREI